MLHFTSLCVHTVIMMTACVLCVAPLHVHSCPRLYDQTDQSATDSDSLNKQVLGAKGAFYWEYMFAAPNLLFKYKYGGGCVCACVLQQQMPDSWGGIWPCGWASKRSTFCMCERERVRSHTACTQSVRPKLDHLYSSPILEHVHIKRIFARRAHGSGE